MTSEISEPIGKWLSDPRPLWDSAISAALINTVIPDLDLKAYSIGQSLTGIYEPAHLLPIKPAEAFPLLELYSPLLTAFYSQHGLVPAQADDAIRKISSAFDVIKLVGEVYADMLTLVKTIQVIQAEQPEIDTSYSHPEVPFSIFVSLCDEYSVIADLRVAESLLHEAMHLKLTLTERVLPLVEQGSQSTYFSPWRGEERPVRGVLHGLFVFCVLSDFFKQVKPYFTNTNELNYIQSRIEGIAGEIGAIQGFSSCPALTPSGHILAKCLLNNSLH